MCRNCEINAAMILASITKGGLSPKSGVDATPELLAQYESYNQSIRRISDFLRMYMDELEKPGDFADATPFIDKFREIGADGTARVVELAGSFMAALSEVNTLGLAALNGMAAAGNRDALGWIAAHIEEIVNEDGSPVEIPAEVLAAAGRVVESMAAAPMPTPPPVHQASPKLSFQFEHRPRGPVS